MHQADVVFLRPQGQLFLRIVPFLSTSLPQHNHASFSFLTLCYICLFCVYVWLCMREVDRQAIIVIWRSEDKFSRQFSPSIMEIPGTDLSLSGSVANTFTCQLTVTSHFNSIQGVFD